MLAGLEVAYRARGFSDERGVDAVIPSARSGGHGVGGKLGESFESVRPFGDEGAVVEVLCDDDVCHGQRQRAVGAGRSCRWMSLWLAM